MKGTVINVVPPDMLNIRDKPGMTGKIIGRIPNRAEVDITATGKQWHSVQYNGVAGYSYGTYLRIEANTADDSEKPQPPARPRLAVLDPGHFRNHNKGAAAGYYEGNWMLVYAQYLETELAALGWKVILTRTTGNDISLTKRGRLASRNKADLFYSLHSNACGDSRVRRVTAFYSVDLPGDRALTLALAKTVAGVMGSPSYHAVTRIGGTKSAGDLNPQEDYYTVMDVAQDGGVPHVVLLEHDFHTNPDVCRWLVNTDNLKRMAKAEAACINEHIK